MSKNKLQGMELQQELLEILHTLESGKNPSRPTEIPQLDCVFRTILVNGHGYAFEVATLPKKPYLDQLVKARFELEELKEMYASFDQFTALLAETLEKMESAFKEEIKLAEANLAEAAKRFMGSVSA